MTYSLAAVVEVVGLSWLFHSHVSLVAISQGQLIGHYSHYIWVRWLLEYV